MKFSMCKHMGSDRFDLNYRTHSNMGSTKMERNHVIVEGPSPVNQEDCSSFQT